METTNNELPERARRFFTGLSNYLDTPILYFGSVQRYDYFHGYSDIDIDIFTENEQSTLTKMQQYMKLPKTVIKKVVWRLNHNKQMVYGYKLKYTDPKGEFEAEFSVYNEKFKEGVLNEHLKKMVLPWYVTMLLVILKTFYYKLGIVSKHMFNDIKKILLTYCIGTSEDEFISVSSNYREHYGGSKPNESDESDRYKRKGGKDIVDEGLE